MSKLRHQQLLDLVKNNGYTSIETLAEQLGYSQPTIRRDIKKLCDDNLLQRFHGGVSLLHVDDVRLGYKFKSSHMVQEKKSIAEAILEKINHVESIFLDTGTTCDQVAHSLVHASPKQILTHNLSAALILAKQDQHMVVVMGGVIRGNDGAITGDETYRQIKAYFADVALIAASGIDVTGRVLDFDIEKVEVKKSMMKASTTKFLLLSSDKFKKTGVKIVAQIADFDYLVTDKEPNAEYMDMLKKNNVCVIIAASS